MSAAVCEGHTETGASCDATCDPHKEEMRRHIERQDALFALASRLTREGAVTEAEAKILWDAGEAEWDDAIHIASPLDGHTSLCGKRGRNLVSLDGERPDSFGGCWGCLARADKLAALPFPLSVEAEKTGT